MQLHKRPRPHSRTKQTMLLPPGQGKLHNRPRPDSCTKGTGLLPLGQVRHPMRPGALVPKNDCVHKLNLQIQNMMLTNSRTYKSVDIMDPSQALLFPVEFLNSLEPTGIPSRNLQLKVGVPIMLLRNLDPPELCNGTRLSVKNLYSHLIGATILTGCAKGRDVFIPWIPLIPIDLPFNFKRIQFPVRLAFAVSINEAQGQSQKIVGIYLQNSCFSHGQLYVACSRVGHPTNLYILAPGGKTRNYNDIFRTT